MRVLSFIPAFLFAAASFVAAAPASIPVDTSCVSNPTGGSGSDAALQPVIAIINNATNYIQPLSDQLSALNGDSCTPSAVSGIVVQIDAVVSTCVTQLKAAAKVELTGLNLSNLCVAIYALLQLVVAVLNTLVGIVLTFHASAVGTIQTVICHLLTSIKLLLGCLKVFVVPSVTGVLGPVIILVDTGAKLLLSIFVKIEVLVSAN
ncbi:hypothetical protein V8E55_008529 [Tylopilus felleus]